MKAIYFCTFDFLNSDGTKGTYNSTTFFSNKRAAEKFGKEACENWGRIGHQYTFRVQRQGVLSEW